MRPPCLAEAPQQGHLVSLNEHKRRGILGAELPQDRGKLVELISLTRVHQQGRALNFTAALHVQFAECGNQGDGKVIDAVKPEVFKCFEDSTFTRAAEPGKNHQLPGVARRSALHGSGLGLHPALVCTWNAEIFAVFRNGSARHMNPGFVQFLGDQVVGKRMRRVLFIDHFLHQPL